MLRIGIVGCGHIARGHAMAAQADDRMKLVAYADVVPAATEALKAEFGGEYTTVDPRRVLEDETLDIVVISTLHDSHASLAIAAAEAGRHVLLEKPVATTLREAEAIGAAVDAAGVKLAVNYKFRLEDSVRRAHAVIEDPVLMLAQLAMPTIEADGPGAWVFDAVHGGGLVMSTGTHLLDLLGFFAASAPVSVQARSADHHNRPAGSPDVLAGQIEFANGSLANIVISDAGEDTVLSRWSCQLYGRSKSAILLDRLGRVVFSESVSEDESRIESAPASMLASLADAITLGHEVAASIRDGVEAVRLAESLSRSAESGVRVSLGDGHGGRDKTDSQRR